MTTQPRTSAAERLRERANTTFRPPSQPGEALHIPAWWDEGPNPTPPESTELDPDKVVDRVDAALERRKKPEDT
jgi:hypothetical protein